MVKEVEMLEEEKEPHIPKLERDKVENIEENVDYILNDLTPESIKEE